MNKPIATMGTFLSYGTGTPPGAILYSITTMPDVEGAPEQIDVTTLADSSRRYIPGVKANEALEFEGLKGLYGSPGAADGSLVDEFATLKKLAPNVALNWQLTYPDGSKHEWGGYPFARSGGAEVNAALGYTLTITPITEITYSVAPE